MRKGNKNLINKNLLKLNPPYKIINTSRAELFNSAEIEYCFENKLLEQYLTDVLEEEPFLIRMKLNILDYGKCSKSMELMLFLLPLILVALAGAIYINVRFF